MVKIHSSVANIALTLSSFKMYYVTKAMPINFINSKCHIKNQPAVEYFNHIIYYLVIIGAFYASYYKCPRGRTHMHAYTQHMHIDTHTHTQTS